MSVDIIFEECLTCGSAVEMSLLENHISTCFIKKKRSSVPMGRPQIKVDMTNLKKCLDDRVPVQQMCENFGVSRRTLFRVLKEANLSTRPKYSQISEQNLDSYLSGVLRKNPKFGLQMFKGFITSQNVILKQKQLRSSYQRVRISENAPMISRIHRRVYSVRAPLSLWHIDGHHKMDLYGFIIHGAIDGYSRLIPYISVENNNFSETVVGLFEASVEKWGYPSSVRSDLGGENVLVADFMINARGVSRNSFRTGKSVHNQRIERLWKDAIERCTVTFMELFQEMEIDGQLDVDSEVDLFCLHVVAHDLLQRSLQTFKDAWNCHPIRTENNHSPMELYISGLQQLKKEQENGRIEGEVPELIQGKKLKPLTEWYGYGNAFNQCVLQKYNVKISVNELFALEQIIDPKSVEIDNLKVKFQEMKAMVLPLV